MIEYRRQGTHILPELVERCHEEMTQLLRVSYRRIFPDLMFLKLASVSVAQSSHHERLSFSVKVAIVLLSCSLSLLFLVFVSPLAGSCP